MANDEIELRIAWELHVSSSTPARELFDAVVARHREPHRRYHGVRHVVWVVRHARTLATEPDDATEPIGRSAPCDLGAVIAAAFFHDAVYQPTAADNEATSARLARRALTDLGDPAWPAPRIEHVARMIRATAGHLPPDTHTVAPDGSGAAVLDADVLDPGVLGAGVLDAGVLDTAILLDADLAVLGADPAAYAAYRQGVRAEYAHVDDTGWRAGRRAVLESFLGRASIYVTACGRRRWEAAARANLVAELASLDTTP